ncbi:twin transmembrane helix small protein [Maritalea sp.]|jgi:putative flippase GtrA|uniref:twin transmembrane helix small protein n=1 Tax=Maritalea sp. TaxID=2003361 RepID=UPI0039E4DB21
MDQPINILIFVALGVVALILFAGLFNMLRGGSPNLSQKLMRARVIAQFIAIVILFIAAFFFAPR